MKRIKITPDWVLTKLPHSHYVDCYGTVSIYTASSTDAHWIELAFKSMNLNFESYDYLDDNHDFVFGFDFNIADLKSKCPSLYGRLIGLRKKNSHKNSYKNLKS